MAQDLPAGLPRPILGRGSWTWALSLAVHVAVIAVGGEWALRSLAHKSAMRPPHEAEQLVAVELPAMTESSLVLPAVLEATRDPVGAVPRFSGGPTIPRVDTGRDGRGGERTVDRAATHLRDADERLTYSSGTMNRLDRDQVQRVRVSDRRTTREDRRSSREPMELAFLSPGELSRLERRMESQHDPARGALASREASARGGALGIGDDGEGLSGIAGTGHRGAPRDEPGPGVRDGSAGTEHVTLAAVARARPDVTRAAVSVEAPAKGRPSDNVDSEQELAAKVQALVHASTAGGVVASQGVGGSAGGGEAGAGGVFGVGSHPTPLGDGVTDWFDTSSTDPRIIAYFRRFHAKVDPLWANAFPKSAMLELKQGTVILDVTISADGRASVAWPPMRPSGVDEFDRNCAEAVRRASPFDPIPKELGLASLHLRAPFVATNPIVH